MKVHLFATVIFLLAASAAFSAEAPDSSYVVTFLGGSTTVEVFGRVEHIVVRDIEGIVRADSECGGSVGNYEQIVGVAKALQIYVTNADAVGAFVSYPLKVNSELGKKHVDIPSKKALVAHYNDVFTPSVIERIKKSNPHEVFCRNGMATIGSGIVWFAEDGDGQVKLAVVNQ
ncbi:hypothetical protein [Hydrocarboniphaga sp.]|uniref:hypothetical protein n=1 Tax=Hydrocarboniphaga sp. TaxID=2033016 RepID=UPI003D0A27A3